MSTSRIFCLLLAALAGGGCSSDGHFTLLGYTSQPTYDPAIRTVFVPIAQNVSFGRGLEFDLTQAVIRDIQAYTSYKVVSCLEDADTVLEMKIINSRKAQVLQNPLNEVRDLDFMVNVEVVWRDLRPGHKGDILSNPKRFDPNELPLPGQPPETPPQPIPVLVTPTGSYQPELGGSTSTALQQAVNRAALQIIAMMEQGW